MRGVAGAGLMVVAIFGLSGAMQLVALVAGLALFATGVVGYCGIYSLLGISTCPIKSKK
jgi:hypothetical protein